MIRHEKDTPFVLFALSFCQSLFSFLLLRVSLLMISSVMMSDCQVVNFEIGGPNDFAPCYSNGFFDLIYKEEPAIW